MVGVPLEQWNGADATRRLEETIKVAQAENAKQQGTMLNWTRVATAMVFVCHPSLDPDSSAASPLDT